MTYAWIITRDIIGPDEDNGLVGPFAATLTGKQIRNHPKAERFTMYDDDGECCYEGFLVGDDASGFEPLEDFGMPNAGCTEIRYKNPKTGAMEPL
jgi:hypothetical protein